MKTTWKSEVEKLQQAIQAKMQDGRAELAKQLAEACETLKTLVEAGDSKQAILHDADLRKLVTEFQIDVTASTKPSGKGGPRIHYAIKRAVQQGANTLKEIVPIVQAVNKEWKEEEIKQTLTKYVGKWFTESGGKFTLKP